MSGSTEKTSGVTKTLLSLDILKVLSLLRIVGGTESGKRANAVNTVGEELENIYYLTGGFYNETVGFYLNGEYDHFTGNISCDDSCKGDLM